MGPIPEGLRVNVYVIGGEVSGPKLGGKLRPVGGDWLTIRSDGIGILDVRITIETPDGAFIYAVYSGVADLYQGSYQRFFQGQLPASGMPIHTAPRFYSAHPDYRWLNRLQCVGIGQAFLERAEVVYDVYAVGTTPEQLAAASWFCWAVPLLVMETLLEGRKIFAA